MSHSESDPLRAARDEFAETGVGHSASDGIGERAGDVINRYKLLQNIGEGGMGTVWMAEQKEPVKRQVALKIIKLGMDTKDVVVRFEAERQALALMDHPNIARVLDGGATDTGRPFFVMELVRGVPITQFCDEARLGVRERLELFTKVCAAVQHAHHKGVIHRDLKPSNVMVTLHDGTPVPKVIDFGIAKATSAELTQKTMFTEYGRMIGTPEYMAPEQAEMSGLDVDTRADIYSLGVLLYELLTGTKPFDVKEVLQRGYQELLRTIREDEPARPSTRISTLGERAVTVARDRHVNAASLGNDLRGDIDWIVMKALEKDRSRRYETANGLAVDLARFLAGEPVSAAPPSRAYRLRKFLARRRRAVFVAAVILVLFVAGAVGTGIGWWDAYQSNRELEQVNRELEDANRDKSVALGKEKAARRDAEAAEARVVEKNQRFARIISFQEERLVAMNTREFGLHMRDQLLAHTPEAEREALQEALRSVNFTDLGLATFESSLIDPTLVAIDARFGDDPTSHARLLNGITASLMQLGRIERALELAQRASGVLEQAGAEVSPLTVTIRSGVATMLSGLGRHAEAEPIARAALALGERIGNDRVVIAQAHDAVATSLRGLHRFEESVEHSRAALEIYATVFPGSDRMVMFARSGMLSALMQMEELEAAEDFARESLRISTEYFDDDNPRVVRDRIGVAEVLRRRGKRDESVELLEDLLVEARQAFGTGSRTAVETATILCLILLEQGKVDEADRIQQEAYEGAMSSGQAAVGEIEKLKSVRQRIQSRRGNYAAAERNSGKMLSDARKTGASGVRMLSMLLQRGTALQMRGKLPEAELALQEALEHGKALGLDTAPCIVVRARLAAVWRAQGRLDEAIEALRSVLADSRKTFGEKHATTLDAMNSLGIALQGKGENDEALALTKQVYELHREIQGERHAATLFARGNYGTMLQRFGKAEEALALFREVQEQQAEVLGPSNVQTRMTNIHIGGALFELERYEEAEAALEAVLEPLEKIMGKRHPTVVYAGRLHARAAAGRGDLEAAGQRFGRLIEVAREYELSALHSLIYEWSSVLLENGQGAEAEPWFVELIELRREEWAGDYRLHNSNARLAMSRGRQGDLAKHAAELERHLSALRERQTAEKKSASVVGEIRKTYRLGLGYFEALAEADASAETEAMIARLRTWLDE